MIFENGLEFGRNAIQINEAYAKMNFARNVITKINESDDGHETAVVGEEPKGIAAEEYKDKVIEYFKSTAEYEQNRGRKIFFDPEGMKLWTDDDEYVEYVPRICKQLSSSLKRRYGITIDCNEVGDGEFSIGIRMNESANDDSDDYISDDELESQRRWIRSRRERRNREENNSNDDSNGNANNGKAAPDAASIEQDEDETSANDDGDDVDNTTAEENFFQSVIDANPDVFNDENYDMDALRSNKKTIMDVSMENILKAIPVVRSVEMALEGIPGCECKNTESGNEDDDSVGDIDSDSDSNFDSNTVNESAFSRVMDEFDDSFPIIYVSDDEYGEIPNEELFEHVTKSLPDWYVKNPNVFIESISDNLPNDSMFVAVKGDNYSDGRYVGVISNTDSPDTDNEYSEDELNESKNRFMDFMNGLIDSGIGDVVSKNPNFEDRWIRPHLKRDETPIAPTKDSYRHSMGHYRNASDYLSNVYGDDDTSY